MENDTKENKPQKKKSNKKMIGILVVIFLIAIGSSSGSSNVTKTDTSDSKSQSTENKSVAKNNDETTKTEDLSNVAKEYTITAGYYTAGIDLPAGECDVVAVSGTGNLSSSNIYDGGVNEMFGIDDGSGIYTSSFKNLKFPSNTKLSVNSELVIKLMYTKIDSNYTGREYDDSLMKTLSSGNYTAGDDFTAGVYKIVALSGTGNLSSSNIYDGGVNEMFGINDGSGLYNSQFLNAEFNKGITLTISGGLTVNLIPVK